ncbi:hypothetical protein XH80_35170 [Bradyrhizobium sp. CCBAU 45384]|nr:hypothetical protein [Bradyrhizobium sp. CCBAU 45384]
MRLRRLKADPIAEARRRLGLVGLAEQFVLPCSKSRRRSLLARGLANKASRFSGDDFCVK